MEDFSGQLFAILNSATRDSNSAYLARRIGRCILDSAQSRFSRNSGGNRNSISGFNRKSSRSGRLARPGPPDGGRRSRGNSHAVRVAYKETPTPLYTRPREKVLRFFAGWELFDPLGNVHEWRHDEADRKEHDGPLVCCGTVARKAT